MKKFPFALSHPGQVVVAPTLNCSRVRDSALITSGLLKGREESNLLDFAFGKPRFLITYYQFLVYYLVFLTCRPVHFIDLFY